MGEPHIDAPSRWRVLAGAVRWLLLALLLLLTAVAVMLPSHTLSWLRSDYGWFGEMMQRLDHASTARFDLTHVVLFAGVGFLVSCLWPRVPWWRLALAALALAIGSEVLQFWAPGREPRVGDAYDDLIGAAVGLFLALPCRWLLRRM